MLRCRAHNPRRQVRQREHVSIDQRQLIDEPVVDDLAKVGDRRVQQGGSSLHFDGADNLADLQFHIDGRLLLDLEREGAARVC